MQFSSGSLQYSQLRGWLSNQQLAASISVSIRLLEFDIVKCVLTAIGVVWACHGSQNPLIALLGELQVEMASVPNCSRLSLSLTQ